jgi:hypothetical protein
MMILQKKELDGLRKTIYSDYLDGKNTKSIQRSR